MWDTILAGQLWHAEIVNRRKDDSLYTEELTITPIADRNGQLTHFVVIKQDITERKRAEQELRQAKDAAEAANQAKSTFLSNMGHEFRTPLNAIIGYSEILQKEVADLGLQDMLSDLARIRQAGQHSLALISDILDVSKIETDRMELRLETFDVQKPIGDVIWAATPLVEQQHNLLTVEYRDSVGRMQADRDKVRQILMDLLSNAAKFTHEGQITLIVERHVKVGGDSLLFHVVDTGIGIAPERIADLFEPFSQMDPSMPRKYGGTGLGLALCQRLCALMGGEISMASEPGRGSTFSVRLPATVHLPQVPSLRPARPGCEENPTCPMEHHQRQ
jgi:signal transduction histidine kinase